MVHFSCDLCGKTLNPTDEPRYVLRLEGFAICNQDEAIVDDTEADSVDAMEEYLTEQVAFEAMDDSETINSDSPPQSTKREYDLCRGCYARMLSDPLGLETRQAPRFSRN